MKSKMSGPDTAKAILGDIQFWVPAIVLLLGIGLLVILH